MTYDLYIFILCAIVFTMLTALLTYLIVTMIRMHIALIRVGEKDRDIVISFGNRKKKKKGCLVDCIVSGILCSVLLVCFFFSLYVNLQEESVFDSIPTLSVVKSPSMASKHEDNTYLRKNSLDNQLKRFDLILTYKKPPEEELKLYDVVVYKQDDILVVHRIVGFEEPNDSHPDDRYYICQGDANACPDKSPVHYSQIKAIYRNERIPMVGSFILFMQSPAGWLCILLVVFALIATPIAEKKILAEEKKRLAILKERYNREKEGM